MPEAPSGSLLPYQIRSFFARNSSRSFSVPQLRNRFGESVQGHLLRLSQDGYLNVVIRNGMPFYELGKH